LTVFPFGDPKPFTANVNWSTPGPVSNAVNVGLGNLGKVSFYNFTGNVHIIVDLLGYYTALPPTPAPTSSGLIRPQTETPYPTQNLGGGPGPQPSVTIGSDGLPIISEAENFDLRVIHCSNPACTLATTTTLVTPHQDGHYSSIAIGTDGLPIISHTDSDVGELRVTHCDDVMCAGHSSQNVDVDGGHGTSITINSQGNPIISHTSGAPGNDLRVTSCKNPACTQATNTSLDTAANDVGYDSAITIGGDFGIPVISHFDNTAHTLRVTLCTDFACTGANSVVADSAPDSVGRQTSITVGADGLPIISHQQIINSPFEAKLRVTHCSNLSCSAKSSHSFAAASAPDDSGYGTSIVVGVDGLPIISHVLLAGSLQRIVITHCADTACSTATSGWDGSANGTTSIAIGTDGLPIVSATWGGNMRVLACGNFVCNQFLRLGRR
jgi:predicted regulator of Ras-like GTPase activity (Roadblock/LC7/MglB family)